MSDTAVAIRILWQSFAYRIRVREANNLVVSVSMMLALALPWHDVLYRTAYALLLNVYVYLINDYCDIHVDLLSDKKDQVKVRYMAAHRGAALGALLALGAALFGAALVHSSLLVLAFVCNTAVIGAYSAWLKRVPLLDLVLMAVAGGTMTIIAVPEAGPQRILGWKLIGLLGLLSAAYQTIQVIRDEPSDRQQGVRTTAVLLGASAAAWIFRAIMATAAAYGSWVVGSPAALGLLLALPLPLSAAGAARAWDAVRLIGGATWLGILAQAYFGGL